ncbi:hypothetical protein PSAC2689_110076 [Paraburkholderia sacchari]
MATTCTSITCSAARWCPSSTDIKGAMSRLQPVRPCPLNLNVLRVPPALGSTVLL